MSSLGEGLIIGSKQGAKINFNNNPNILTVGGGRNGNGSSFTMFDIKNMSGSFFKIVICFGHAGGGSHGSYLNYAGHSNAYTGIVTLENHATNYGGGQGFTISKPDHNTVRVTWNGASDFADGYSMSAYIIVARSDAYIDNIYSGFGA